MEVDTIYQYLKYPIFEVMVKNKTIRLSDIRNSNDTTELQLRFELFKKAFISAFERDKSKDISLISKADLIKLLDENTDYIKQYEDKRNTEFVSCFSENGDLLSQWRGYAQGIYTNRNDLCKLLETKAIGDRVDIRKYKTYGGVAVGFSLKKLQSIVENYDTFTVDKVRYTENRQVALFRSAADDIIRDIRNYIHINKSLDGYNWNYCAIKYQDSLIKQGVYAKNDFFKEEKEWRLCMWGSYSPNKVEYNLEYPDVRLSNCEYSREYNDTYTEYNKKVESGLATAADVEKLRSLSPYYDLYMGERVNEFIKEVVIGPKCQHTEGEIKQFLLDNGINCKIRTSKGMGVFVDSANHKG